MSVQFTVVSVWVILLLFKIFLIRCEVVLVNRHLVDSFRVGKDGCTKNGDCPDPATCQSGSSLCLCSVRQPNFRNPTTSSKAYGCVSNENIQKKAGTIDSCEFGPFQLIPYSSKDAATQFINLRNSAKAVGSCFLRNTTAKFPDKATEAYLLWLNESYIDLTVLNKILLFKWKRSVPNLQGATITVYFHCHSEPRLSYFACLRAKVLGTWQADNFSLPTDPTVVSTKPKSSQKTWKATSESNANASSPEDCSDLKLLNYIFIGLLCLSFIVNIVFIIFTRIQLKRPKRNQNENVKMEDHDYEVPNYEPLRRKPLENQNDENKYQSLITSPKR